MQPGGTGNGDRHAGAVGDHPGNHAAVSELIGAIILTAVIVAGVTIVGVVLWSQPPPQKIPHVSVIISNQSCTVFLYHNGGDVLARQALRILVDGTNHTADFTMKGGANPWSTWGNGDTLQYTPATCAQFPQRVDIIFDDGTVNAVIGTVFFGAAQPTGVTPTPSPTLPPIPPLVADFSASPVTGQRPLEVMFTDTSTGQPTGWNWIFGDTGAGNTSGAQNPSYLYTMHGRYTVNLTVTDAGTGRSSMNRTTYINVTPNPAWYSCNWQHRKVITINHNMVYGTQSFFPVLINLTSDNDLRTGARSNGYDILFTSSDGVSKLPHEIEKYTSGSGALTAWVKVPAVTDASDTTLYLYYGNPAAGNQQDRVNVWTASFQSVWHLNETTGGTNAIKDATSTSNDGTGRNSPTLGAAGKFGNAVTFDGTNDYISTETQYTNPQTFTISLWFKTTNAVSRKIFGFESSQTGTGSASWDRQIYIGTGGYLLDGVYDGNTKIVISDSTMNDGNWHNAVMTHASNTLKLYVDGSFIGQNATSGAETTTGYWRMGSYKLANWPYSSGDGYFQGTLDEVRIAPVERSPEWIATEYLNQNSPPTFYSVGNEEQWTC